MNAIGIFVLALSTSSNGAAARPAAPPQAPEPAPAHVTVVTGCVASDNSNGYQLRNVATPGASTGAFKFGPRPAGLAITGSGEPDDSVWYSLETAFKLKSEIGRKVEVTGTVAAASEGGAAGMLKVRTVRMLHERCN